VHINLNNMIFISWTLCQICLFEFIPVKGGVKFMKHVKGDAIYNGLASSGIDNLGDLCVDGRIVLT
jgi:hypothetical protein